MIADIEGIIIKNPGFVIENSETINSFYIEVKGRKTSLEIMESPNLWIAVSKEFPGEVLGYFDHRFAGHMPGDSPIKFLHQVSDYFINPGFMVVQPEFREYGVGNCIVEQRKIYAGELEKIMLVNPTRDGKYLDKEKRDYLFPYSDERLRNYYLKRGFREFTQDEAKNLTFWLDAFKDRTSRLIDKILGPPEAPPIPDPIFGNTFFEFTLRFAYQNGIASLFPGFLKAIHNRRPMDEWRQEYEKIMLESNTNYQYVMMHLLYDPGLKIDIGRLNPHSHIIKKPKI